jgi:hypothetical protein
MIFDEKVIIALLADGICFALIGFVAGRVLYRKYKAI